MKRNKQSLPEGTESMYHSRYGREGKMPVVDLLGERRDKITASNGQKVQVVVPSGVSEIAAEDLAWNCRWSQWPAGGRDPGTTLCSSGGRGSFDSGESPPSALWSARRLSLSLLQRRETAACERYQYPTVASYFRCTLRIFYWRRA